MNDPQADELATEAAALPSDLTWAEAARRLGLSEDRLRQIVPGRTVKTAEGKYVPRFASRMHWSRRKAYLPALAAHRSLNSRDAARELDLPESELVALRERYAKHLQAVTLVSDEGMDYAAAGRWLGVTRERVRQLVADCGFNPTDLSRVVRQSRREKALGGLGALLASTDPAVSRKASASELGASPAQVRAAVATFGLQRDRSAAEVARERSWAAIATWLREHPEETHAAAAEAFGVHVQTIYRAAAHHGLSRSCRAGKPRRKGNPERIVKALASGTSVEDAARGFDVSPEWVRILARKAGLGQVANPS